MIAMSRSPIRVVGRYALYSEIAAGGMATIHLGRLLGPVGFARTVAVKRLHPQFAKDPEFVSMFLDEARLAARVQHPNVVATIDVVATDGELFLIMDYVRGESLSKILRAVKKRGLRVPPRIASAIMCGFLHGLHAAHEAKNERGEPLGLIHRDVSPQNVLVGSDGIARVLDFGIAKAAGRIQVTRDGQIKGKLAYMPPEQLVGRELTRGVDIYASAVVMWETLTGVRLFKCETEGETLSKILTEPVPAPSTIAAELAPFDGALLRALSREVPRRQLTAKELALDLERCFGMASPTQVGEWVEDLVGAALSAREDQIAAIESSSTALRVSASGRPIADSGSDSDASFTSSPGLHIPRDRISAHLRISSGQLPASPDVNGPASEDTQAGTRTGTVTAFGVPMDRRLPIFATIAGMVVLLVIIGAVVMGKFSAAAGPPGVPSASAVLLPAPPPPTATHEIPPVDPAPSAEPSADPAPPASASAPPRPAPPPRFAPAPPRPSVTAAPPPPPKKNCDPNYTMDAQGRKKYKLECM